MSAEFDSGAFVRERAWHGLGTVLDDHVTTAEFIRLAGMDWQVVEQPIYLPDGRTVEGYKALVRSDNGRVLNIASDNYVPLQNIEAFRWFDPFIQDGDLRLVAAVSLRGGKRIALTAEFTQQCRAEVVKGDEVELKLVLYNSHDGTLAAGIRFSPTRVVCNNTLAMVVNESRSLKFEGRDVAMDERTAKSRHSRNLKQNLEYFRECINLQKRQFFTDLVPQYQAMTSKSMSIDAFRSYLEKVYQKPCDSIRDYNNLVFAYEFGIGQEKVAGTVWAGYNALTQILTHKPSGKDSLLFGRNQQMLQRAHQEALALTRK